MNKIKVILLLMVNLFLCTNLLYAKSYEKITLDSSRTIVNANNSVENVKKIDKIKLRVYDVSYDNFYKKYSLFPRTKKEAKRLLQRFNVTPIFMKKYFNSIDNKKAIIMNAIIYDYYYHRPDLAENFYKLINNNYPLYSKILKADFLVVTKRVDKFNNLYAKVDCLSNFNILKRCCYYLGLTKYFETGNNKQSCFISSGYKIAKDIYYGKIK